MEESNFLWKIFAPNSDGIIVKSTPRKIYELFADKFANSGDFFLGKIDYWTQSKIKSHFEDEKLVARLLSAQGYEVLLESLFIKRKEFLEEQEMRLIYFSEHAFGENMNLTRNGYEKESKNLFESLAEELILDPRIHNDRIDPIKKLIKDLGYGGPIRRSTLMDIPSLQLRVDTLMLRKALIVYISVLLNNIYLHSSYLFADNSSNHF